MPLVRNCDDLTSRFLQYSVCGLALQDVLGTLTIDCYTRSVLVMKKIPENICDWQKAAWATLMKEDLISKALNHLCVWAYSHRTVTNGPIFVSNNWSPKVVFPSIFFISFCLSVPFFLFLYHFFGFLLNM